MATEYSTAKAAGAHALTALFRNTEDADSAYGWLLKYGYKSEEIHLLMSEETRRKFHYPGQAEPGTTEEDTVKGLETGAAVGGGLGAALGILAAVSASIVIPGIGLAVAGPLAASLAGAGGLVGGALGALYGSSIPEEKAHEIEQRIKEEGNILISVIPHNDEEGGVIQAEWRKRGAEIIHV